MLPPVPCSAVDGILAAAEGAGKEVVYVFLQEHGSYAVFFTSAGSETSFRLYFPPKKHLQKACKIAPQETI